MARLRSAGAPWLVAALAAIAVPAAAQSAEDAAQASAEAWLRLVDGGSFPASWDQAAKPFKAAQKQAEWAEMAQAARAPLGKLASRRLKSRELTQKPPTTRLVGGRVYSWGEGQFVVLHYDAAYANKAVAETVVAMAEADGAWRVAGYSIR